MPATKGHVVHAVPMLSPVLEDFVPPQFRGNVADEVPQSPTTISAAVNEKAPATETAKTIAAEAPPNRSQGKVSVEDKSNISAAAGSAADNGLRSRLSLILQHWRRRVERGPVQVPLHKPHLQVRGLPRQRVKKRPAGHFLNPFCLLAKLRDSYIHMMNGVATSGIVASGGPGGDSSAQHSTLFYSREFDSDSMAQLMGLDRNGSQADSDYWLKMAIARNSSRVKPFGEPGVKAGGEPVLTRSKSTRNHAELTLLATTRSGRRLSGEPGIKRSKSNTFSDEVFYSRKLKGSRKKKLHVNPYADSDWKADTVSRETKVELKVVVPNEFHFQREKVNACTESRTAFRLEQSASTGSLFEYKH